MTLFGLPRSAPTLAARPPVVREVVLVKLGPAGALVNGEPAPAFMLSREALPVPTPLLPRRHHGNALELPPPAKLAANERWVDGWMNVYICMCMDEERERDRRTG
eukprot:GHVU01199947.1.p1 GENE.GHVU01199947.1~~GHVU01199947.1.p1  ORF type:complete len:105 (+),score=10.29 GHVU01199947.1:99-413(+)